MALLKLEEDSQGERACTWFRSLRKETFSNIYRQCLYKDGQDEYFYEAGKLITESGKSSIGMLQRKFKIGFNRAARIMDALSESGVVGPEEGTKPRAILMTPEEFESMFG